MTPAEFEALLQRMRETPPWRPTLPSAESIQRQAAADGRARSARYWRTLNGAVHRPRWTIT